MSWLEQKLKAPVRSLQSDAVYVTREEFKEFQDHADGNSRSFQQSMMSVRTLHDGLNKRLTEDHHSLSIRLEAMNDMLTDGLTGVADVSGRVRQLEQNSIIDLSHGSPSPSKLFDSSSFHRILEDHKEEIDKDNEEYVRIKEEVFEMYKQNLLRNIRTGNIEENINNIPTSMDISPIQDVSSSRQKAGKGLEKLVVTCNFAGTNEKIEKALE